jgi:hypothetical protein
MFKISLIILSGLLLTITACASALDTAPKPSPEEKGANEPAVQSAKQVLADELSIAVNDIKVIEYEEVQWRNSCLGVEVKDQMCLEVITPGYKIILEVEGTQYEAHTDQDGNAVRFIEQPTTE